jgi:Xaa-Pro aminopeptidase
VRRVLRASIQGLTIGKKWKEWQKEAEQIIEKECVELGLLSMRQIKRQDPDEPAFKEYFMHGIGHPLGLDVHDVGFTTEPFQENWVMTVEPAIYIREEGLAVRQNSMLIAGMEILISWRIFRLKRRRLRADNAKSVARKTRTAVTGSL